MGTCSTIIQAISGIGGLNWLQARISLSLVVVFKIIVSADPGIDRSGPVTTVLHGVQHVQVKKNDFLLLVGTTKGAFILQSNAQRKRWKVGGPYFHGQALYAMAYDGRIGQHRIWASTQSIWGTMLRSADDFGKSWTNPLESAIRFPGDSGVDWGEPSVETV